MIMSSEVFIIVHVYTLHMMCTKDSPPWQPMCCDEAQTKIEITVRETLIIKVCGAYGNKHSGFQVEIGTSCLWPTFKWNHWKEPIRLTSTHRMRSTETKKQVGNEMDSYLAHCWSANWSRSFSGPRRRSSIAACPRISFSLFLKR